MSAKKKLFTVAGEINTIILERLEKNLLLVGFISISVVLFIISVTPPAPGYEMYIAKAYPPYFWFFIILAISCGMFILIRQSFSNKRSNWWIGGLTLIILANLIIYFLPVCRGYALYGRGDVVNHLGIVKDILFTGNFSEDNYYPISHILTTILTYILNIDPKLAITISPAIFYILYIIGIYLLATVVSNHQGQVLLITAFAGVLLFTYYGSMFLPTHFSLSIIPLILFLFYKKRKSSDQAFSIEVLFVILLLLIPFFHPVTSVQLIITFLIFPLSIFIFKFLNKQTDLATDFSSNQYQKAFLPTILVFVTFFIWFSYKSLFRGTVKQVYNFLILEIGTPPIEAYQSMWIKANLTFGEFLKMLFKSYGHELIYVVFSFIALLILLKRAFSKKNLSLEMIFFLLMFIIFSIEFFPFLFGDFMLTNPQREFEWALVASTVLNGMFYHQYISDKWQKRNYSLVKKALPITFLFILIIISVVIGIFSFYSSPLMGEINSQVTNADLEGMNWYFDHFNHKSSYFFGKTLFRKFSTALINKENRYPVVKTFSDVPSHFGYTGENFKSDGYLIITDYEKKYYMVKWPEIGSFTKKDFIKLDYDPQKNLLYSNKTLEVWEVVK
jgi:hypothetical protein